MTIVVLGIIAGTLAPLIRHAVDGYIDTQERTHLFDKVRVSLGRLSRELRQSTVPLTTAGATLQFTTTTEGGRYVGFNDSLPQIANTDCSRVLTNLQRYRPGVAISTLCVLHPGALTQTDSLVIGGDVAQITNIALVGGYANSLHQVTFNAPFTFTAASDTKIFSLADFRHQISLVGSNLIWQRDVASAANFNNADSGVLLSGVTAFNTALDATTGIVRITLTATENDESVTITEDVYVRN